MCFQRGVDGVAELLVLLFGEGFVGGGHEGEADEEGRADGGDGGEDVDPEDDEGEEEFRRHSVWLYLVRNDWPTGASVPL